MERAIEKIIDKITTGREAEHTRYSEGLPLGHKKASKGLRQTQIITAIRKQRKKYKQRRNTINVGEFSDIELKNTISSLDSIPPALF